MHEDAGTNTGLLLYYPYRDMEIRVVEALHAAGFADLSYAQARIFQRIGPDGTRTVQLAEQARVTKQTASLLVQALEEEGYVERRPDPADARARLVSVAERGRAAQAVAAGVVAEVEEQWRRRLGARRYAALRRGLAELHEEPGGVRSPPADHGAPG
ncbi:MULTISPECIES: MarR family winged helix-turn-helix transcriptional regulator [Kocuria]|uniref:MarR family winged helix-turn-helix transcriptional regulator n=1 Tax=Kocuria TaxID=57493 RepID=UPI000F6E58BD|nr:MarR family transcriptional regulator [Kocuria rosea]MCC5782768.1 MarR family transcriptional regulator [Kocuria sp. CCUG 69068]MEB2526641.1 MarR family transcriptional regulator [Kocuria rosea]MEB2619278.1 MarR family transcriptional regulator [Kocuria rosea]WIG16949.1 MarR family transcriptional regulator [Kocuria rosea]WJZ66100.1 MarR family transcriptional regulator [Kocuria rosea]